VVARDVAGRHAPGPRGTVVASEDEPVFTHAARSSRVPTSLLALAIPALVAGAAPGAAAQDGTPVLVKDIAEGSVGGAGGQGVIAGGALYFKGDRTWRSDGTAAGTVLFHMAGSSGAPTLPVEAGEALYFADWTWDCPGTGYADACYQVWRQAPGDAPVRLARFD